MISIHAPHAGSDVARLAYGYLFLYFNPRSPCGERPINGDGDYNMPGFQSTLPMRGATKGSWKSARTWRFQSTLPMRGATESLKQEYVRGRFQSTLPMRGAT